MYKISESTDQSSQFSHLPVEIYNKIFDHLSVEDIINLRQLNKHFRFLIDNCESIWQNVFLGLDLDEKPADFDQILYFSAIESFLMKIITIDSIWLQWKSSVLIENHKPIKLALDSNRPSDYKIIIGNANINRIFDCLVFISSICRKLTIEALSQPYHLEIELEPRNEQTFILQKLECFALNASLLSENYKARVEREPSWFSTNFFIKQMDLNFPSLVHLHLYNYSGSIYLLYEKLGCLENLRVIEFDSCWKEQTNRFDDIREELDSGFLEANIKLKIEKFLFIRNYTAAIIIFLGKQN